MADLTTTRTKLRELPWVLPKDVRIFPTSELDPRMRERLSAPDDAFAVTRLGSRTGTKIVDPGAAWLLEEFREPRTVAEAARRVRASRQWDGELPMEALRFLDHMIRSQFLVDARGQDVVKVEPSLAPGDRIGSYNIVSPLHMLDDTELHLARTAAGDQCVVKLVTPRARRWVVEALKRERDILERLDGTVNARLLESSGEQDEALWLALEWCSGPQVGIAAGLIRRRFETSARRRLLILASAILRAYANLHSQGVVHGDVHPKNVLVDPMSVAVKLVDFGLARLVQPDGASSESFPRGGMTDYFEPEYAQAALDEADVPDATFESDQYALGALLYQLFTGSHYIESALEPRPYFERVCGLPPRSFEEVGCAPWRELEAVLGCSLEKDPEARFPSVEAFAEVLSSVSHPGANGRVQQPRRPAADETPVLENALKRYEELLDDPQSLRVPRVSVNFGAAGLAYFFYRASCLLDRPHLLAVADQWLSRAEALSRDEGAFYDGEQLTEERLGRSSLYHGPPGVLCVAAVVASAFGNTPLADKSAARFLRARRLPTPGTDLTTGLASNLLGCAILRESLAGTERSLPALDETARALVDRLWSRNEDRRHGEYIGMAHGLAGRVFATLRWSLASGDDLPAAARNGIDRLVSHREPGRAGVRWPLTPGGNQYWPGWCHGAAGHVFLWALLAASGRGRECAQLAELAAEETWHYRTPSAGHLCCGSAGQGYALLSMYRLTGDEKWIQRARRMLAHARTELGSDRLFEGSLYKGDVGVALLEADLARPELSAMPFFEPEDKAIR